MSRYLAPLGIFIMGNMGMLLVFLFFPALGAARVSLAANTSAMAGTFWGWTWVVTSVKLIVFLVYEACILWAVGKVFLAQKSRR